MMVDEPPPEFTARHVLFATACERSGWTCEELWIGYAGCGGTLCAFDLEAYLAGLMPMQPGQQDVLACALNERLWDLYAAARVPYLTVESDAELDEKR